MMEIRWHGTAALTIRRDGYTVAVDPFVGMPIGETDEVRYGGERARLFKEADAVLVTHGHFDHIYDIPALYRDADTPIYATETPIATLTALGMNRGRLHLITPPQEFILGGMTVRACQGRHCTFDLAVILKTIFRRLTWRHPATLARLLRLNKAYPENLETLFYEIEADGKRVQLMGSMGLDDDTVYPTGADLLILPFQGTGDPAKTVRPLVERLRPKRIVLDHYDDAFPPMSAQIETEKYEKECTAAGTPCEAMKTDRVYQI
jgi:L-ascorbate metabolism protein UlaG (beta-lactamase superfamily)